VDDTTKDISALYRSSRRYSRRNRDLLIDALMGTRKVVALNEFNQDAS
jgi:hypothetical protein